MKSLLYVHKKVAKGRTYYYFDTGLRDDRNNRILKRLPDIRAHGFAAAYQAAKAQRTRSGVDSGAKTFDWLVRIYERSPEFQKLAPNSQRLYSRHLAYANENLRNRHGRSAPLEVVSAQHLAALRDKYAQQPGTANAIMRSVGAMFHWAAKPHRRYVKVNLTAGIEPLETGEHRPWPEWLIEEALADPTIRLPVALLYFLGQRIGDTVKLGRVNMAGGEIKLTQQKTRLSLTIAIHKRLAEIIEADVPKDQLMFLLGDKGKPVTESGLRQRIQKWAKARGQSIVPHGLRKNAVNALLESGCSAAEVSAITGQSLQMIEHYAKERDRAHLGRSAILKFEARNKS
jgi:integrase